MADGDTTQDGSAGFVHSLTDGGMTSEHPPPMELHVQVAPTPDGDTTFNAIRAALVPVACWRLDDAGFEFDSSFVVPETKEELTNLAELRKNYPNCPLTIFGHADPVGTDDYNKKLSGRRSQSVYALFTRNDSLWESLYSAPLGGDNWGLKSVQIMLQALDGAQATPGRYDPINTDGHATQTSNDALKNFQTDNVPPANGQNNKATRKVLFLAYMDWLFQDAQGATVKLDTAADFLGKGADPDNKADYQGCGEFNPVLLLGAQTDKDLDDKSRNVANAPNRRVVVYFFRPGSHITPSSWPCPSAKEGVAGCRKRFWSDSKTRLQQADDRRKYEDTRDTMACRFYDRFSRRSPCEAGYKEWVVRILHWGSTSIDQRQPFADEPYKVVGSFASGRTDANGIMRVRAHASVEQIQVKIAGAVLTFDAGGLPVMANTHEPVRRRLYSLGYGDGDPLAWQDDEATRAIAKFETQNGLTATSTPDTDQATSDKIKDLYGS